jgi:outer membrane protein
MHLPKNKFFISLLAAGILGASAAHAAETKIGFVRIRDVLTTTNAGKKARTDFEAAVKAKQDAIKKEDENLEKQREAFEKKSGALSEAARAKQGKELQEKYMAQEQQKQMARVEFQRKEQEMIEPIIRRVKDASKEIANKKGYSAVLELNDMLVLYSNESDDFTKEVIEKLNKDK